MGTSVKAAAHRLVHRIEIALAEGPTSSLWPQLRSALPGRTFQRLLKYAGVPEDRVTTVQDLLDSFRAHQQQLVSMGRLATRTVQNYKRSLGPFQAFVEEDGICFLREIGRTQIERFITWRLAQIQTPGVTGAATVDAGLFHLHHLFSFAVDRELIERNPVKSPPKRFNPEHGAQPFSPDEVARLEAAAKAKPFGMFQLEDDWFPYLVARWTGFRPSDAITFPWKDIKFDIGVIEHVCGKNGKRAVVTLLDEVLAEFKAEQTRRNPRPDEPVLLNPQKQRPFTLREWYEFIKQLGQRAQVHAYPYRFRDTFAVDLYIRQQDSYPVAKALADTQAVVELHYLPYVKELQMIAVCRMNQSAGLEQYVTPPSQ